MSGDGLRLRCCRSGHGQRLRGDDCRLAGDDAEGVGLRDEREKHNELAQTSKDSVFVVVDSRVQVPRSLVRCEGGSQTGGGDDGGEILPLDREPWRQKER